MRWTAARAPQSSADQARTTVTYLPPPLAVSPGQTWAPPHCRHTGPLTTLLHCHWRCVTCVSDHVWLKRNLSYGLSRSLVTVLYPRVRLHDAAAGARV